MTKKLMIFGVLTLALMIVMISCTPDDLEGSLKPNQAPRMGITNIDYYDSLFTFNAVINWYGTDADGQVMYFYYKVVQSNLVGDSSQAYDYIDTAFADIDVSEWTQTEETEVTVNMIASASETDTLYQYVFFMCEDDQGAFSSIKFYALYRVNRLPQTYIDELPGNGVKGNDDPYIVPDWSLPDTNALWSGLKIAWSGDDTLDFPDGAPDFEYKWELYGPFSRDNYSFTDSIINLTLDSATVDKMVYRSCTEADDGYFQVVNGDTTCDGYWVWDKEVTLTNLRTGCYIFKVVARDDALVPDPTPAWGLFLVIEPSWIAEPDSLKDILIIQSTQYKSGQVFRGWPHQYYIAGSDTVFLPDSVMSFYEDMIGGTDQSYSYDIYGMVSISPAGQGNTDFPDLYTIAKYRMIIIDDMDYQKIEYQGGTENSYVSLLMDYLNVGGKVWIIGRSAMSPGGLSGWGLQNFLGSSLAVDYFDLSAGIYVYPNFNYTDINHLGEFIGATSIADGISDLVIDSVKVQYLQQNGIHKVEVLIRNTQNSTSLYTYNAANPDTLRDFQYMPCAVKYYPLNHVYKTSYFSFPLYLMDNSNGEVQAVFTEMLNWFLSEEN